jgi:hypothetical protein
MSKENWIYEHTPGNQARFVLGEPGVKNLICFGINPSTAEPGKLDPTLTRVKKIMLNVYAQRATNPNDMHNEIRTDFHAENLSHIANVLKTYNGTIWAAWGTLINKRPYLKYCLNNIGQLSGHYAHPWVTMGQCSKAGHPHHPLYLKLDAPFDAFSVPNYIKVLL